MTKTVVIEQVGGPEMMRLVDVSVGDPGVGEVRIRHHAIGLNYIDVYQRSGALARSAMDAPSAGATQQSAAIVARNIFFMVCFQSIRFRARLPAGQSGRQNVAPWRRQTAPAVP